MSRSRRIAIGHRLAAAAVVALLGFTLGVRQPAAQLGQTGWQWQWADNPEKAKAKTAPRRAAKAVRKRRVVRSSPNQRKIAERTGYKRLSDLVNFPKFFPGLGILFVKPDSFPLGPFLCFDRKDRLVATVFMVPIRDIDEHKSLEAPGFAGPVDHVTLYFNQGHPGVDVPHYHVVIWHVSRKDESRVAN